MRRRSTLVSMTVAILCASGASHGSAHPFAHEDPRWQMTASGSYAILVPYGGELRRGGGVDGTAQVQLTTAFSVAASAGYLWAQPPPGATSPTHAMRLKLMVRYDLDVIHVRPYLAVGGAAVLFFTGEMKQAEQAGTPGRQVVGANFGPQIEAGLDWRPVGWLVVGLVVDMGWLMRFRPAGSDPWPSVRTAGVKVGLYF